jgi:hypothetical protein
MVTLLTNRQKTFLIQDVAFFTIRDGCENGLIKGIVNVKNKNDSLICWKCDVFLNSL